MFQTLFGAILLIIPFLLIFCFKNRLTGFLYIFGSVFIFNLFVALVTQSFHIFTYPVVIIIHLLAAVAVLFTVWRKTSKESFKIKINWLTVIGFLIIFFELWSVHFFYTGTIRTIDNEQIVSRSAYSYPLFSDEWIGVAFSNYSIDNNALPTINPLAVDRSHNGFSNIFIGFFSLISEIFLIIQVPPLLAYVFLSIAFSLLICLLIFLLLKAIEVDSFMALLATLFIPWLANGSNLPGLWYLIPCTAGIIIFLLSLIGFSLHKYLFSVLLGILSCLFYPPIFVLVVPTIIVYLLTDAEIKNTDKLKMLLLGITTLISAALLIIYIQTIEAKQLFDLFISSAWRLNLDGGIPTFYIWKIVPVVLLPFSIIGIWSLINKKKFVILTPLATGLCLWAFYSFSQFYIFIDYARVVVLTSFLLVVAAGFGSNYLFQIILKKSPTSFTRTSTWIGKLLIIIIFFVLSFFYTNRDGWRDLRLNIYGSDSYLSPAAPVNHYLVEDDLRLFNSISHKRFLAPAWKGLVIGAATNNYPIESKSSIITNRFIGYSDFINTTCESKVAIAKKEKIAYIYSIKFNCDKFLEIGHSQEGLYLYKFNQ